MPKLILLFLTAFLVGADEFLLGPILTPVGADLHTPPERVALFITAYSLPLAILAPVLGALSDRFGRASVLVPSLGLFGLASISTALVSSFEIGLLTRIATGAASGGMLAIALAQAGDLGPKNSARGFAFVSSGLTLGIILSPGIGSLAAQLFSWRLAFMALGGLALAVAVAGVPSLSRIIAPHTNRSAQRDHSPLLVPGAAGSLAAMVFGLGGAVGIFALVGERMRDQFGLDTSSVGLVYAGFGMLTLVGNLAMPTALAHLGSGRRVMRMALVWVLAAVALTYSYDQTSPYTFGAALVMWAIFGGLGAPALQNHIAQLSDARRGTLMALAGSCLNLGVATSSALAAFAYGHDPIWVALLGMLLLSIAILALQPVRREMASAERGQWVT